MSGQYEVTSIVNPKFTSTFPTGVPFPTADEYFASNPASIFELEGGFVAGGTTFGDILFVNFYAPSSGGTTFYDATAGTLYGAAHPVVQSMWDEFFTLYAQELDGDDGYLAQAHLGQAFPSVGVEPTEIETNFEPFYEVATPDAAGLQRLYMRVFDYHLEQYMKDILLKYPGALQDSNPDAQEAIRPNTEFQDAFREAFEDPDAINNFINFTKKMDIGQRHFAILLWVWELLLESLSLTQTTVSHQVDTQVWMIEAQDKATDKIANVQFQAQNTSTDFGIDADNKNRNTHLEVYRGRKSRVSKLESQQGAAASSSQDALKQFISEMNNIIQQLQGMVSAIIRR